MVYALSLCVCVCIKNILHCCCFLAMVTDLVGICFFVGEWVACSVGANFTPHIITVNTGEVHVDHSRCRVLLFARCFVCILIGFYVFITGKED